MKGILSSCTLAIWTILNFFGPGGEISALAQVTDIEPLDSSYVGVIPNAEHCPRGYPEVLIKMDLEDDDNDSFIHGWAGGFRLDPQGNVYMVFCKVPGSEFRPLADPTSELWDRYPGTSLNYAVLRMSESCPYGSYPFSRYFDNEDNDNGNYYRGNISPNAQNTNTTLEFCLFLEEDFASKMGVFPDFGFSYGVLPQKTSRTTTQALEALSIQTMKTPTVKTDSISMVAEKV
jgi:hypothetical protein